MSHNRRIVSLCLIVLLAMSTPVLLTAAPSESPVADAAMIGDVAAVRALLEQGVDANAAQGDGMTALHWAALNEDAEMAQMLIYAGANLRATTRNGGYTPLLVAGRSGSAQVIGALIGAGADPNGVSTAGTTPLMLAAAAGSADAVEALIAGGAEIDRAEFSKGQTALMFAASSNRVRAMKVLLEHGADTAAVTKVVDLAEREESRRRAREVEAESPGGRPAASRQGRRGRPPAQGQATGQAAASGEEGEDTAKKRQGETGGQGTEEDAPEDTPPPGGGFSAWSPRKPAPSDGLTEAQRQQQAQRQFFRGMVVLVGKEGGMSPLLHAARQGYIDASLALLDAGADINQTSADGTSPLLIASINGHYDLAMTLLEKGADPTVASDANATPLYATINVEWAPTAFYPQPRAFLQQQTTYLELMQALLDRGADPDVRLERKLWYTGYNFDQSGVDEKGATAFWRAAQASDVDAMRLLVANGADPTIPTLFVPRRRFGPAPENEGERAGPQPGDPAVTPLQVASGAGNDSNYHRNAPYGWLAAVKYLVEELGADVNAADPDGRTPLLNAAYRGDNEMIRYLAEQGADLGAVDRRGRNAADWANGPIQRLQPFEDTLALLAELGAPPHNDKCVSC